MAIIIGSARISEDGTINGAKGDQTGREVAQESYYRHRYDWDVLRCKDPNRALMMSYDMASACNNPAFGYSQSDRYSGLYEAKKVRFIFENFLSSMTLLFYFEISGSCILSNFVSSSNSVYTFIQL